MIFEGFLPAVISFLGLAGTLSGQVTCSRSLYLDSLIQSQMQTGHVPGLAACIIKEGEFRWIGTYGYANFEWNIPVDTGTLFGLASISKTPTMTALMQLWEDGLFDLDDDINDYSPFSIRNPYHPGAAITFRMLCTHTSGIRDNWDIMTYYWGEDCPIPMDEYLFNYLNPEGAYYYPDLNFYTALPGMQWSYSNIAVMLVGYLVEVISGMPFDQYCQEYLFDPLEMYESSWFLAGLDTTRIAMPYHWNGNGFEPYGFYGYADYPDGLLRTSIVELGHFLNCYMQYGLYAGQEILSGNTVDTILHPQIPNIYPNQGLVWFKGIKNGRQTWGHGGADLGVATIMDFAPSVDIGVIVLTNGENHSVTNYVENVLFQYGEDSIISTDVPTKLMDGLSVRIYPNPFSSFTEIVVSPPIHNNISVNIYDLTGSMIRTFNIYHHNKEEISIIWDGKNQNNIKVGPGIYFVIVRVGEVRATQKVVFMGTGSHKY
jgi:CubicO group peptidase (beta-lactamase class C family)